MSTRIIKAAIVAVATSAAAFTATSFTVCCAASTAFVQARIAVEGRVVDDQGRGVRARVSIWQNGRSIAATESAADGTYTIANVPAGAYQLRVEATGFTTQTQTLAVAPDQKTVRVAMVTLVPASTSATGAGRGGAAAPSAPGTSSRPDERSSSVDAPLANEPLNVRERSMAATGIGAVDGLPLAQPRTGRGAAPSGKVGGEYYAPAPPFSRGEGYAHVAPNRFRRTSDEPLSTFGADVDTASFANVRRFLKNGQLPPADAVRVEEFINYFRFDYAVPRSSHPIGVTTEVADAPWNPRHKLVLIGARAVAPGNREIAGRNIVLLVDVSGSMASEDKLPLLKSALGIFVDTLKPTDVVSIVTYAGSSGVALQPTRARDRMRILSAIEGLGAGGSTNGAGGITTAYRLAREAFIEGGVNRVMLATDGDFNVGVTSQDGLLKLIEREKESGVFLSVLGVGTGNLQDATMELLADKGNGHYSYLDSMQEARRVLVREVGSTLETVAKDVKFQVEFNPAEVSAWKLIGYENRLLAHEDFNDDRKDGGEIGAGHTVTVLYEVVPVGVSAGDDVDDRPAVDPLRYQGGREGRPVARPTTPARRGEWLTVKVRYQQPDGNTSRLIAVPVSTQVTQRPVHLPFAAAVAEYGLLLREPRNSTAGRWDGLIERLESMPVQPSLRADRDQVTELAVLARDLSKLR